MARQIEGTIKHWRGEFGFVLGEDGADYFLHSRERLKSGMAFPKLGDRVAFTPERGPKGLRAVGVRYATQSAQHVVHCRRSAREQKKPWHGQG